MMFRRPSPARDERRPSMQSKMSLRVRRHDPPGRPAPRPRRPTAPQPRPPPPPAPVAEVEPPQGPWAGEIGRLQQAGCRSSTGSSAADLLAAMLLLNSPASSGGEPKKQHYQNVASDGNQSKQLADSGGDAKNNKAPAAIGSCSSSEQRLTASVISAPATCGDEDDSVMEPRPTVPPLEPVEGDASSKSPFDSYPCIGAEGLREPAGLARTSSVKLDLESNTPRELSQVGLAYGLEDNSFGLERCWETSFGCRRSSYWLAPRFCICVVMWSGAIVLFAGLVLYLQGRFINARIFIPISFCLMGVGGGMLFMGLVLCVRGYLAVKLPSSRKHRSRPASSSSSGQLNRPGWSAVNSSVPPADSVSKIHMLAETQEVPKKDKDVAQSALKSSSQRLHQTSQPQVTFDDVQPSDRPVGWTVSEAAVSRSATERSPKTTPSRPVRTPNTPQLSCTDSLSTSSLAQQQSQRHSGGVLRLPSSSAIVIEHPPDGHQRTHRTKSPQENRNTIVTTDLELDAENGTCDVHANQQVLIFRGWQPSSATLLASQSCRDLDQTEESPSFYANLPDFVPERRKSTGETGEDSDPDCSVYQTLPANWPPPPPPAVIAAMNTPPKPTARLSMLKNRQHDFSSASESSPMCPPRHGLPPRKSSRRSVIETCNHRCAVAADSTSPCSESHHHRPHVRTRSSVSLKHSPSNEVQATSRRVVFLPRGPMPQGGADDLLHEAFLVATKKSTAPCTNASCPRRQKGRQDRTHSISKKHQDDQAISSSRSFGDLVLTPSELPKPVCNRCPRPDEEKVQLGQATSSPAKSGAVFMSDPEGEKLVSVRLTKAVRLGLDEGISSSDWSRWDCLQSDAQAAALGRKQMMAHLPKHRSKIPTLEPPLTSSSECMNAEPTPLKRLSVHSKSELRGSSSLLRRQNAKESLDSSAQDDGPPLPPPYVWPKATSRKS